MTRVRFNLSFDELREANVGRCESAFHPLAAWSATDWATAVAGEVGEACNLIKKQRRGEPVERVAIALELADAVIYLDLLAARLGIDLGEAVAHKFNVVSVRRAVPNLLPEGGWDALVWTQPGATK